MVVEDCKLFGSSTDRLFHRSCRPLVMASSVTPNNRLQD